MDDSDAVVEVQALLKLVSRPVPSSASLGFGSDGTAAALASRELGPSTCDAEGAWLVLSAVAYSSNSLSR